MGLVHRSISFRWLTRDNGMNKSRIDAFVATKEHGSTGVPSGSPPSVREVTAGRDSCRMAA
jgi:hypothetical protein